MNCGSRGRPNRLRIVAILGSALTIAVSGCAGQLGPGSLLVVGNEGEVCLPAPEEGFVQLGGIAVEQIAADTEAQSAEFVEAANAVAVGAYLLPLNGSFDLVGFDHVDTEWETSVPAEAIVLDGKPQPLVADETYNLVLILSVTDKTRAAMVNAFVFQYSEGGVDRRTEVPDSIVIPPLGEAC